MSLLWLRVVVSSEWIIPPVLVEAVVKMASLKFKMAAIRWLSSYKHASRTSHRRTRHQRNLHSE